MRIVDTMNVGEFYAYTAAFIDGEGSIQINPAKASKNAKNIYWTASVHAAQNDVAVLDWMRDRWDLGSVNTFRGRGGSNAQRTNSRWSIYGSEVEFLLSRIAPYLRVKQQHALVVLAFRQLVSRKNGGRRGGLGEETSAARTKLALELRQLNSRNLKGRADAQRIAR